MRRRVLLYAALALCVPLPAFALSQGVGGAPPAQLAVNATLGGCALADTRIVCQIDVSYDAVPNATRYTASVTRPDGSVIDQGAVGPSPTTLWVPYVGNGVYLVEIAAYGEPEEPGGAEQVIDRDETEAEAKLPGKGDGEKGDGGEGGEGEGAEDESEAQESAAPEEEPQGEEADAGEADAGEPAEPACPEADAEQLATPEGAQQATDTAEQLAEAIDCP